MNHVTYTSYSIIYISLIIHSYPTKTDHQDINKHPIAALSRLAPHSGWGVSLRRDVLAQASPPSPRRGLEKENKSTCGISLRRDPSRLGEVLARSKRRAGRLGDLSRKSPKRAPCLSRLGETDPLGRDLQVAPLVRLEQPCFSNQANPQSVLTH